MHSNAYTIERMTRTDDRTMRVVRNDRKRSTDAKRQTIERRAVRRNKRGF